MIKRDKLIGETFSPEFVAATQSEIQIFHDMNGHPLKTTYFDDTAGWIMITSLDSSYMLLGYGYQGFDRSL